MAIALVSGALANKPLNGGNAWTRLSWVLGLRQLGLETYFVEQIAEATCVDAAGAPAPLESSVNLGYFRHVVDQLGLNGTATLLRDDGARTWGMRLSELADLAASAELLVNISGHLTIERLRRGPRRVVYFDDDPGFTQFWHALGSQGPRLDGHDYYYTIGTRIGTTGCPIPTGDVPWRYTRPPTTLEHWPAVSDGACDRFTTVGSWRGPYGPVEYAGVTYGLKVHEFRKVAALPERSAGRFEVALDIHPADGSDLALLRRHGWELADPKLVAADPFAFRRYVQASGAEFSVAQGIYVQTSSGWFSDRTVRYLASGKPALVQDTGFSRDYPVGEGLIPFRTLEDAVAGAEQILGDYDRHARAARALAEAYFDAKVVLGRLLEEIDLAP